MKAFPTQDAYAMSTDRGMDLRDYFAAKAMQGMLANPVIFSNGNNKFNGENLETCYQIADAMMEVRD